MSSIDQNPAPTRFLRFHGAKAFVARAFEGLNRQALALLLALAVIFSLTRTFPDLFVNINDGELVEWLSWTGAEVIQFLLQAVVMILLIVPAMNFGPQSGWRRVVVLALAVLCAAPCCAATRTAYLIFIGEYDDWSRFVSHQLLPASMRYGFIGAMLTVVAEFYRHETRAIEAMHGAQMDRLALDREMAEARLQVLQAQIEPHFLFNTLANVRRLYQTDLSGGRAMLDNLMRYLEVALPRMRESSSTLAREASLVEAYLNVQQIRMGRRLSFEIDIADELGDLIVPPMMLLTLVENAIKHGLNPLPEGGFVRISAHASDAGLALEVSDTGRGFGEGTSGGGTGLANIRARLAAMYGVAASLGLSANAPRGVTAALLLPSSKPMPATAGSR